MITFPRIFVFALAALLPGCTLTPERREQLTRQRHYERLLRKVKPGMTRQQLYAILPPRGVPVATPPHCDAIIGIALFTPLMETHPLDADFSLDTQYRIAQIKDYPLPWPFPGYSGASLFFSSGHREKFAKPSRQNPRDELLDRPSLAGPGVKTVINIRGNGMMENLVVDPRRQLKFPKPRTAPSPKGHPRISQ